MSELGQHLKSVREEKGITLEDLQATTKIQKRYLVAIEEGRFETLPGVFYARAFVKTYAESVGIDPEQLFDQFKDELPNPQKEIQSLPSRSERASHSSVKPNSPSKKNPIVPLIAGFLTIVVFVALAWLIVQALSGNNDSEAMPPNDGGDEGVFNEDLLDDDDDGVEDDEQSNGTEGEETEEEPEEPETVSELNFVETQGTRSFYELSGTDELAIQLVFNDTSYFDIKDESGTIIEGGSQPSAGAMLEFDFSDESEIDINLGASQNVELYVNEERVEFELEASHQYVRITLTGEESS
ncbi:helix-turn-helix domain-containing protein [Alkalihalobacillus pseudalcaliphilus]|uniref:helix-turn-helix domain-containing protein n=1 Tax=Alkalihalobacillus pseudalcaliphilus TaxID=79884 RepID=UPI00064DEB8A|nr:RodZ domain-containing protein [Alkalihalobacillus pseudalcaliphilus]KMK77280.1 hypothetical protein AB990_06960 [Alkalihalobacillus pseudalcaliphilus]